MINIQHLTRSSCLILLMTIVFTGCSSDDADIVDDGVWAYQEPEEFPVLKATGYAPLVGQPGDTKEHRLLAAMRVSKLDAYRNLLEQVYGQELTVDSSVQNWAGNNDEITSRISGVIRGAKVTKSYQVGNYYIVEMELDFELVWHLFNQFNIERVQVPEDELL